MKSLAKLSCIFFIAASLSSCWTKLGDLSVVSNRVIHDNTEYVELARYIEGKGRQKKKSTGALENAVEDCIKQVPNGEFLKNVTINISNNGRKVKIKADVWGKRTENYVDHKENIKGFNVGDRVQNAKRTGTITALVDEKQCLVQFDGDAVGTKMEYERLIKIDDKKINTNQDGNSEGFSTNGYKVGDTVQFTSKDFVPAKIVTGKVVSISTDGSTVNVEYVSGKKYKTVTVPVNELSKGGN